MKNNRKGFTLVEVLIAVLLISISTAALVAAVTSAVKINRTAKEKDLAFRENLGLVQTFDDEAEPDNSYIIFDEEDEHKVEITFYTSNNEKDENLSTFKKS